MTENLTGLTDWFQTPPGQYLLGWEQTQFDLAVADLFGYNAIQLGLPLDQYTLTVMVLVAALPSASNVSLLAERFQADTGRIARIILVSTVAAFFTFSGAVALLT